MWSSSPSKRPLPARPSAEHHEPRAHREPYTGGTVGSRLVSDRRPGHPYTVGAWRGAGDSAAGAADRGQERGKSSLGTVAVCQVMTRSDQVHHVAPFITLPLSGWAFRVEVTLNQPSQYSESGPRRVPNSSRT